MSKIYKRIFASSVELDRLQKIADDYGLKVRLAKTQLSSGLPEYVIEGEETERNKRVADKFVDLYDCEQ